MDTNFDFSIAGLLLRFCSPGPLHIPTEFQPFLVEYQPAAVPDAVLEFLPIPGNTPLPPNAKPLNGQVFLADDTIIERYYWQDGQYIYRYEPVGRDLPCRFGIPADFFPEFCRHGNWLRYLAAERLFLRHNRVILHASSVLWNGKAYLFTAPSGGGKSTQADLWTQLGARLLNGDKTILDCNAGRCTAYGSPIAGSSEIYRSLSAPVTAIFRLQKSNENRAAPLSRRSAFLTLYGAAVKCDWDPAFAPRLLDALEIPAFEIPMFTLDCTPTPDAVRCALETLKHSPGGGA